MENKFLVAMAFYGWTLFVSGCSPVIKEQETEMLGKVAFGSCASQEKPQPIWETVVGHSPDLFLFIGDNIYADTEDMTVMKEKYGKLAAKPGYQKLRSTCKILSTWDDHDYGVNDGDATYSKKEESEEIFLDFFEVDSDSPRRKRPGIYGAETFGPTGKKVQVILLDTRYFKGQQVPNRASKAEKEQKNIVGWYLPTEDTTATILGEAQWEWLEDQLEEEANVRIIASSIQVVPFEKGMESWRNFPHERKRLFRLIEKTKATGVIFISGDVHFSEISKTDEGIYPFYDFTSSGITNYNEQWSKAVNSFRLGNAFSKPNFGLITFNWEHKDPVITMQSISEDGKVEIEQMIKLSELSPFTK